MGHVTHDQAFNALSDPNVPGDEAARLFEKAHRRSNEITKAFVVYMALLIRSERKRKLTKESE